MAKQHSAFKDAQEKPLSPGVYRQPRCARYDRVYQIISDRWGKLRGVDSNNSIYKVFDLRGGAPISADEHERLLDCSRLYRIPQKKLPAYISELKAYALALEKKDSEAEKDIGFLELILAEKRKKKKK